MAMSVVYSNFCGMLVHENRGGIGQITPVAAESLRVWCCDEGIGNPWGKGNTTGGNWCKGARAARNYLTCVGLERYGPPYSKKILEGIKACAKCLALGKPCEDCFKLVP